ncbi:YtxH domain-containing protein [Terriglobus aquaticus]|uniref:YtxH domain-containing protein n=1 Tax=Terriglobus aquaticus TaxID=940139 RepID=A0ABW9KIQ1_9BACT|nr:YtxH domain-containing protein [Terriglobus aquaticus]
MADESSSGLGWFLAGLGIGALIGVLYAPKSGRETREDLASGARDVTEKANQYVAQSKDQINTYVAQGKDQLNDYVDKGRDYYEKGRTQWSQYVDKGKDFLAEQQTKLNGAVDAGKQAYQEHAGQNS